jgi:hypothetical protein
MGRVGAASDNADRRRLRGDNDVGFILDRLWNAYKHRLPLLAAMLARDGGR